MPKQLIFTSTPTGIQSGRSGFQVVAQHDGLNNRLIQALEKESIYEFADSAQSLPVICKYQKFEFGDDRFSVLTRMQNCGVDFTGRPNHIAHHLIFEENEIPNCPPSAIFALWKGWRNSWGKPRYLGEWDRVNYENDAHPFNFSKYSLPAKTWFTYAGDEGCAALPLLTTQEVVVFPTPSGKEDALLWLFFESQSLIDTNQAWNIQFTNFLTENDNPLKYNWLGLSDSTSVEQLSVGHEVIDVFSNDQKLAAPDHSFSDKARKPLENIPSQKQTSSSAISIAPLDESEVVQDELEFNEDLKLADHDELLDHEGSLPDQHSDEDFEDIFKSEDEGSFELPEVTIQPLEEDTSQQNDHKRFRIVAFSFLVLIATALLVFLTPDLIESINRFLDPAPVDPDTPTFEEIETQKRVKKLELDPETRFVSQLGEVDEIIKNGQFLLARAYLSKYRGDSNRSITDEYKKLDQWFEKQKSTLELVNRKTGELEKEVLTRKVLPSFQKDVDFINEELKLLATDLRPSLEKSLLELIQDYEEWLKNVRLKTENAPTFFIPISKEHANPEITFRDLPNQAVSWMSGLDQFESTSQIEHIQIQVSPFLGLNQFHLSAENAISLTLWKESDRSLLSYIDGQTKVIRVRSNTENTNQVTFSWLYGKGGRINTKTTDKFPEPPLILNFLNKSTSQSLNVVMMGGISQQLATLAEIPFAFTKYLKEDYKFVILDPVLKEKLDLFVLPPDQFLKMRSIDNKYMFAWDHDTADFNLYQSINLEDQGIKNIQNDISLKHKRLNELVKLRDNHSSVRFIQETPLWSLGEEILKDYHCPSHLKDFGHFSAKSSQSYFEYLRQLIMYFAEKNTLIRPSVMEKWLDYPKNYQAKAEGSILTYRNMLLRTSKRLKSLLDEGNPNALEHWRNFVTNFEFWLLGEYEAMLLEILTLSPEEIQISQETDIEKVKSEIQELESSISEMQKSLDKRSNVTGIENVKEWIVEIGSLNPNKQNIPLILFQ